MGKQMKQKDYMVLIARQLKAEQEKKQPKSLRKAGVRMPGRTETKVA